jgi:hypothetical protein
LEEEKKLQVRQLRTIEEELNRKQKTEIKVINKGKNYTI